MFLKNNLYHRYSAKHKKTLFSIINFPFLLEGIKNYLLLNMLIQALSGRLVK